MRKLQSLEERLLREPDKANAFLDDRDYEILKTEVWLALGYLRKVSQAIGATRALDLLDDQELALIQPDVKTAYTLGDVKHELAVLHRAIEKDLFDKLFMYIPTEKAEYYNKSELFGAKVKVKFPEANKEIIEAGNCYAAGNNTACIFHLMRAVEHGMRALALKLNVIFPKNPQTPMELKTWGEVIGEVIKAINAKPNAKTKSEAEELEFYNTAADQIQIFKDAWRDVVMHSREPRPSTEHDAMSVIVSVRKFMQLIAEKL